MATSTETRYVEGIAAAFSGKNYDNDKITDFNEFAEDFARAAELTHAPPTAWPDLLISVMSDEPKVAAIELQQQFKRELKHLERQTPTAEEKIAFATQKFDDIIGKLKKDSRVVGTSPEEDLLADLEGFTQRSEEKVSRYTTRLKKLVKRLADLDPPVMVSEAMQIKHLIGNADKGTGLRPTIRLLMGNWKHSTLDAAVQQAEHMEREEKQIEKSANKKAARKLVVAQACAQAARSDDDDSGDDESSEPKRTRAYMPDKIFDELAVLNKKLEAYRARLQNFSNMQTTPH